MGTVPVDMVAGRGMEVTLELCQSGFSMDERRYNDANWRSERPAKS